MSVEADRHPDVLESAAGDRPTFGLPTPNLPSLLRAAATSLLVSLVVFVLACAWTGRTAPALFQEFGFHFLPAIAIYAALLSTLEHVRWCGPFLCMPGMMVGMTVGMIAGFLPGYYVGATNGLFVGCLFSLLVGIGLGCFAGYRSGVMSFMEGAMAGMMSGPMGAMTSVMLLRRQAETLGVVLFFIGVVILGALHCMIWVEQQGRIRRGDEGRLLTVLLSLFVTGATLLLMMRDS